MRKLMVIVIVCILFLYGCKTGNTTTPGMPTVNYRTGTQALSIGFLANTPPARMYDGDRVTIMLDVRNKGAEDIESGTLYVSGFDASIIPGMPESQPLGSLAGKARMLSPTEGEFTQKSINSGVVDLKSKSLDTYPATFLVTACYPYSTIINAPVCIDPDPGSTGTKQKVCTANDVSLSGGQGAPISVTKVAVSSSPGKTRFTVYFDNVGGGTVFSPESLASCNPYGTAPRFEELDTVRVDFVKVANADIVGSCKPSNKVRLINGKGFVFCEFNVQGKSAFNTALAVKLSYGYRISASRQVTIVRTP